MNTTTNAPLASIPTTLSDDDLGELVDYCHPDYPVWETLRDIIEWHNRHVGPGPNGCTIERCVADEDPDTYIVEAHCGNGLVVRSLRNDVSDLLYDTDFDEIRELTDLDSHEAWCSAAKAILNLVLTRMTPAARLVERSALLIRQEMPS